MGRIILPEEIVKYDLDRYQNWLLSWQSKSIDDTWKEPTKEQIEKFPYWREESYKEEKEQYELKKEGHVCPIEVIAEQEIDRILKLLFGLYGSIFDKMTHGEATDNYYYAARMLGIIDYLKELWPIVFIKKIFVQPVQHKLTPPTMGLSGLNSILNTPSFGISAVQSIAHPANFAYKPEQQIVLPAKIQVQPVQENNYRVEYSLKYCLDYLIFTEDYQKGIRSIINKTNLQMIFKVVSLELDLSGTNKRALKKRLAFETGLQFDKFPKSGGSDTKSAEGSAEKYLKEHPLIVPPQNPAK